MSNRSFIKKLKEAGVVQRGSFTLKSGRKTNLYIDLKRAYGYPRLSDETADKIAVEIDKDATCIAVAGYGGLPLGALVSQKTKMKLVLVREEEKDHGTEGRVDGYKPGGKDKVVIVDDVLMRGTNIRSVSKELHKTGADVTGAVVVVKRGSPQLSLPVKHLVSEEDLV